MHSSCGHPSRSSVLASFAGSLLGAVSAKPSAMGQRSGRGQHGASLPFHSTEGRDRALSRLPPLPARL